MASRRTAGSGRFGRCAGRAADAAGAVFAANRATGRIAFHAALLDGVTRRSRVYEDGSLRVRVPNATDGDAEAVIVNTAGGMAGGDRFSRRARRRGDGADLVAGTAAAEKIYRAIGADAEMTHSAFGGRRCQARLAAAGNHSVRRARLNRRIEIDLADGRVLADREAVVFGRAAMDETIAQGALVDRWRIRRTASLFFADTAARRCGRGNAAAHAVGQGRCLRSPPFCRAGRRNDAAHAVRASRAFVRRRGRHFGLERDARSRGSARRDGAALRRDLHRGCWQRSSVPSCRACG